MLAGLRPRLTYANVMATVAVGLSLGGSAYAVSSLPKSSVGTKQLKNGAVTTKKIKNGAVTASKLNPSGITVPHATVAGSADPVAFAHASRTGTLDTANSKNVGSVKLETSGDAGDVYCLSGIPFTPRGGQATVDAHDTSTNNEWAQFGLGAGLYFTTACPTGTQAYVITRNASGSSAAGFFVELYR